MDKLKKYPASKPAALLKRIQTAFPELSWHSYTFISEGWDHEVIILDNQIVFRFPNDDEYAAGLRTEIEVLKQLAPRTKIAIPNYTLVAPDYSFAGYSIITGERLDKKFFDTLSDQERQIIAQQLADFLTMLHTLMSNGYDFSAVRTSYITDEQIEVKQLARKHLPTVLNPQDFRLAEHILDEVDSVLNQPTPIVLLHGDIYSGHFLWDRTRQKLGLIDFSDMTRSDPAIDFAELYEYGMQFTQQVYDLYKGPKDSTFLERAWIYQRWIGIYMMTDHFVYHKTSFAVARETFDRVKDGPTP